MGGVSEDVPGAFATFASWDLAAGLETAVAFPLDLTAKGKLQKRDMKTKRNDIPAFCSAGASSGSDSESMSMGGAAYTPSGVTCSHNLAGKVRDGRTYFSTSSASTLLASALTPPLRDPGRPRLLEDIS